jgi:sugar-specific transcriptional regulator TrmB
MLDILGLDGVSERVYEELVTAGAAGGAVLAERTGLPREAVEASVDLLVELGLASRRAGADSYAAAPPAVALGALLAERRYALQKAELAMASLAESYRSASADRFPRDLVEVVCGQAAVLQRFEQVQRGAVEELLVMTEARREPAGTMPENTAREWAINRGVRYRVIVEQESLENPDAIDKPARHLDPLQQSRVVERVPGRLIVADRSVALASLSDVYGEDPGACAMYVRAPGMIRLLISLFESVWERAVPVRLGATGAIETESPPSVPTDLDLRILTLLMLGSTDAAISDGSRT